MIQFLFLCSSVISGPFEDGDEEEDEGGEEGNDDDNDDEKDKMLGRGKTRRWLGKEAERQGRLGEQRNSFSELDFSDTCVTTPLFPPPPHSISHKRRTFSSSKRAPKPPALSHSTFRISRSTFKVYHSGFMLDAYGHQRLYLSTLSFPSSIKPCTIDYPLKTQKILYKRWIR